MKRGLGISLVCAAAIASTAAGAGAGATSPSRAVLIEPGVVAISIDGLNPKAITRLGREDTPALHRMMRQGASTLNARTEVEQTETLPNHTGMVTGRRIDAGAGGHGVTWNDNRLQPRTVQDAAGHRVDSIFSLADRNDLDAALYAAKTKLSLFERSWPAGVDEALISNNNTRITQELIDDLGSEGRPFSLLHISLPDKAGHADGWLSPSYLEAVRSSDALVGQVLDAIADDPQLAARYTVILTADHGGVPGERVHADEDRYDDYRVPFLMWGRDVTAGTDLYDLSEDLRDPGREQVRYGAARQPVRNGDVANAAAELLGLPAVSGSRLNAGFELDWN